MRRLLLLIAVPALAADLPPDKSTEIPASGKRPVVVKLSTEHSALGTPAHDLPSGYKLEIAAAAPLVTHPIMGCLDDQGRLFIGDGVGVNWNKKQLEANPPNRVLMLEDTDKDGSFDKSTIFADKMTFPQGACWLNGSLYVCSPPGLWKLTDTDNDGVADQREMIVGGFEYTGNAADVHGPFLHPNGRLYWCHGRKGHDVKQKDGTLVDESLACGIWSCQPDGSDIAWHSLGCGDNPVEVDFTPDGDIIGVQNLYYSQPRGDTIIHWLYGGVYERGDQLKAIAHLPRTLETMPVMYNFGHVAVSGCCFWRNYRSHARQSVDRASPDHALASAATPQQFMVTHFNTQRLVRMELTPEGSTYKAVENEFLKLHNPDIHLTDVMEDADGSLLLIDTGGWFRIGCPSSLMAKSDLLGAVYRIKPMKASRIADTKSNTVAPSLMLNDPQEQLRACQAIAESPVPDRSHNLELERLLAEEIDPSLEHAVIYALAKLNRNKIDNWVMVALMKHAAPKGSTPEFIAKFGKLHSKLFLARSIHVALAGGIKGKALETVLQVALRSRSDPVVDAALFALFMRPELSNVVADGLKDRSTPLKPHQIAKLEQLAVRALADKASQDSITEVLNSGNPDTTQSTLRILAAQTTGVSNDTWIPALDKLLAETPTPLVLDAIKKLKTPHFDTALQAIANDTKRPLSIRLKALDSAKSVKLTGETFTMVKGVLADATSSAAAKIQAAGMIAAAPLQKPQLLELAPLFATLGPVELKSLLAIVRKSKEPEVGRTLASEIAKNPVIASQQESLYRTAFSDLPPDLFETIILPAYNTAAAATEAKKRQLGPLAEKVIASGNAMNGRKHFDSGKGTCIACHKIGDIGRPIGPDLSHIGAIRTERDLLESILFPSNTLSRDYEAHVIETSDGQQTLGVIKSHTAEGLLVIDIAGQEKTIAHQLITGDTTLPTSLMPLGLDQTLPEPELLDLVAWLRSLK
ncbi:MAG: PVC-type heme-binding CxxCH protein [Prosthecobacter sp.]|uniref:PVC-type heme-binding CxxCH protein n=1 Tax=Prosthecobacter sp. TaxID=1965333 RepID=UPI00390426CF